MATSNLRANAKSWADMIEEDTTSTDNTNSNSNSNSNNNNSNDDNGAIVDLKEKSAGGLVSWANTQPVKVQQADENSPLHSVTDFGSLGLPKELLDGVLIGMRYDKPSKIQESALPVILKSEPPQSLIAQAQSGTGKTAAFSLGMLFRSDANEPYPQAICVCPTRELAVQTCNVVMKMGQFTKLKIGRCIPGETFDGTAHILIGTPGTFIDMMQKRKFEPKKIKVFVLDEADNLLDSSTLKQQVIQLHQKLSHSCQLLFFSATFPDEVLKFADGIMQYHHKDKTLAKITLAKKEISLSNIKQFWIGMDNRASRLDVLDKIYGLLTIGQSIIFARTQEDCNRLAEEMTKKGHTCSVLHSGISDVKDRDKILADFRSGVTKVLIATAVLSRGIDIEQVTMVIMYDIPVVYGSTRPDVETYYHMMGRSGRFGKYGICLSFCYDNLTRSLIKTISEDLKAVISELKQDQIEDLESIIKTVVPFNATTQGKQ